MDKIGGIVLDGDATYVSMLDATGCPVLIDCSIINASVVAAILRTIRAIVCPVELKCKINRTRTEYNRHVSNVLKALAAERPEMPRNDRMKYAVNSWSESKQKQNVRSSLVSVRREN